MSACKTCGGKAGAFKSECKSCEADRVAQEAAEAAARQADADRQERERLEREARALEARRAEFTEDALQRMRATLAEGRTPCLYTQIYVESDGWTNGQPFGAVPDLLELSELGKDGWEIAAVIPRTMGIGLSNRLAKGGSTWGGGLGGLVAGVHIVLQLAVTEATLSGREDIVRQAVSSSYRDGESSMPGTLSLPALAAGAAVATAAVGTGMIMGYGISYSMPVGGDGEGGDGFEDGGDVGDDGGDFGDFEF
jgi:hypothetical protein